MSGMDSLYLFLGIKHKHMQLGLFLILTTILLNQPHALYNPFSFSPQCPGRLSTRTFWSRAKTTAILPVHVKRRPCWQLLGWEWVSAPGTSTAGPRPPNPLGESCGRGKTTIYMACWPHHHQWGPTLVQQPTCQYVVPWCLFCCCLSRILSL